MFIPGKALSWYIRARAGVLSAPQQESDTVKKQPKFGKRPNPQAAREAEALSAAIGTVREWLGERADAATVNRFAASIARR